MTVTSGGGGAAGGAVFSEQAVNARQRPKGAIIRNNVEGRTSKEEEKNMGMTRIA